MFKRILAAMLIAVTGLGITLITPTAAMASYDDCPAGKFCTYWDLNGGGAQYYYSQQPSGTCINIGNPWNDQVTSVYNRTDLVVWVYKDANCTSTYDGIIPYWPWNKKNLTDVFMNDEISSLQFR